MTHSGRSASSQLRGTASEGLARYLTSDRPAPSDVLALTYGVTVPVLEHLLIEPWIRASVDQVCVITDDRVESSVLSGLGGAEHVGANFALVPIQLPAAQSRFHPKLVLRRWTDRAVLTIMSANLTSGGLRRNLEVVDEISLDPSSPSGSELVFRDLSDFLEALAATDPGLRESGRAALEQAATSVRQLADQVSSRKDDGIRFLHSMDLSLWEQVIPSLQALKVSAIRVVSPFFDETNAFLTRLLNQFPKAKVTIVKCGSSHSDFAGGVLASFANRLSVFAYSNSMGVARRLHAKVYVFEAEGITWLLTGSPNATEAAWCRSVAERGNLEVALLRTSSATERADALWADLATNLTPLRLADLTFSLPDEPTSQDDPLRLRIVEARLYGQDLHLELVGVPSRATQWAATLESAEIVGHLSSVHGRRTLGARAEDKG